MDRMVNLRTVVELASRGRVIRRRLPARSGGFPIFVSPDSALQYWLSLDRSSALLFDTVLRFVRSGDTVWDVGANCGLLSFAAAHAAGRTGQVVAVEPDVFLVSILRRSATGLPPACSPVEVLPCAVSDQVGVARFNIARRGRSTNFLASGSGRTDTGGVRESVTVMTVTLDWMLDRFAPPSFVKIDVEGAEIAVLSGAKRVLDQAKPIIFCETDAASRVEVGSILRDLGYSFYDAEALDRGQSPDPAFNTLALPPGKTL